MPNPPTPVLGLTVPTPGGDSGVWGPEVNNNWTILDGLGQFTVLIVNVSGLITLGTFPETIVLATGGAAGISLNLPAPNSVPNKIVTVKKIDSALGPVRIFPAAGSIDGQPSYIEFNQYQYVRMLASGGNWNVVGNN